MNKIENKNYEKMKPRITKKYINELTYQIIGAAIEVHKIIKTEVHKT